MDEEQEQAKDNIAKQIAINQEQKNQIENLQAKINSFSQNQSQVSRWDSDERTSSPRSLDDVWI